MNRKFGDRILFTWSSGPSTTANPTFAGERLQLAEPKGRKENANFLIVWKGMDWSGFLTYEELLGRMAELERSRKLEELYLFDAVERI
jgi:hypothetical protein